MASYDLERPEWLLEFSVADAGVIDALPEAERAAVERYARTFQLIWYAGSDVDGDDDLDDDDDEETQL